MRDVPALAVPYILIQGGDDRHELRRPSQRGYFDAVRSTGKAYYAIDGGHFACFTNAAVFADVLRRHLMPLGI